MLNNFVAYQNGRALVRALRPVIEYVRGRCAELASQIENATISMQNNLAEGSRRAGKDRRRLFTYADGSLSEIAGAIETAEDLGWPVDLSVVAPLIDRQSRLLWGLTHDRRRTG